MRTSVHQLAAGSGRTGELFGAERALQEIDILGRALNVKVGR